MKCFLLLIVVLSISVAALDPDTVAIKRATNFVNAAKKICGTKTINCLEPLLHKDFRYVVRGSTMSRSQFLEHFRVNETQRVFSDYKIMLDNAKVVKRNRVYLQYTPPPDVDASIPSYFLLTNDTSVEGGEAAVLLLTN